jgi:hypothetical protein
MNEVASDHLVFRYFERPHAFSTYREELRPCDLCGRQFTGYDAGAFRGARDVEHICEECIVSGRLDEWDLSTNEGDVCALRQQLRALRPELRDEELEDIARKRTVVLEQRTPQIVTWQDWFWPAHCGDYCCYVKEIGRPEIERLASDGDGVAFFASHCPDVSDMEHARGIWEGIRPDAPTDARNAYSVGVYLFRCMTCGEPVLMWDCD